MTHPILVADRIVELTTENNFRAVLETLATPLVDGGYIQPSYITAIEESVASNGPYFVIAPMIALPHAQAGDHVQNVGLSIARSNEAIDVAGVPAKLFIMLASNDSSKHLEVLSNLVMIMDTDEKQQELLACPIEVLQERLLQLA